MDQLTRIHFDFKAIFVPLTNVKALSIIIIVGFIVYGNMLFNGFVWDDKTYVVPSAKEYGLNLYQLFAHNPFNSFGYYRPIPATYFSLIHVVFGEHTFFYHLIQLSLHITNTVLFYFLISEFIKNESLSFCLCFSSYTPYKWNPFHISLKPQACYYSCLVFRHFY